jgi:hypothetical protein
MFTHLDLCSVLDSIRPYWCFPNLCQQFSLLDVIQRVSFVYYLHLVHMRDTHGRWFMKILFIRALPNHQYISLHLVLDDEIYLNDLLSTGLLPSTSTHLLWNQDIELYEYLEAFDHQWQVLPPSKFGNTLMSHD